METIVKKEKKNEVNRGLNRTILKCFCKKETNSAIISIAEDYLAGY